MYQIRDSRGLEVGLVNAQHVKNAGLPLQISLINTSRLPRNVIRSEGDELKPECRYCSHWQSGRSVFLPGTRSSSLSDGCRCAKTGRIASHSSPFVCAEELAGIDVFCSDKTGTLSQNKLTLGDPFRVSGIKPRRSARLEGSQPTFRPARLPHAAGWYRRGDRADHLGGTVGARQLADRGSQSKAAGG